MLDLGNINIRILHQTDWLTALDCHGQHQEDFRDWTILRWCSKGKGRVSYVLLDIERHNCISGKNNDRFRERIEIKSVKT